MRRRNFNNRRRHDGTSDKTQIRSCPIDTTVDTGRLKMVSGFGIIGEKEK